MIGCLSISAESLASEREVVINERRFRVDDDVEGFLSEELYRLAFTRHPYHWPTIGWLSDIQAITTDECRAFYRTYYAPNNAIVVVAGDLDRDATLGLFQLSSSSVISQPKGSMMPCGSIRNGTCCRRP